MTKFSIGLLILSAIIYGLGLLFGTSYRLSYKIANQLADKGKTKDFALSEVYLTINILGTYTYLLGALALIPLKEQPPHLIFIAIAFVRFYIVCKEINTSNMSRGFDIDRTSKGLDIVATLAMLYHIAVLLLL